LKNVKLIIVKYWKKYTSAASILAKIKEHQHFKKKLEILSKFA